MTTLKLSCSRRAVAASAYVNTNWRFTQTLQRRQQLQLQQQLCRRLSAAAAAAQTTTTMPKSHANMRGKLNHYYYANYACCNCLLSMRFWFICLSPLASFFAYGHTVCQFDNPVNPVRTGTQQTVSRFSYLTHLASCFFHAHAAQWFFLYKHIVEVITRHSIYGIYRIIIKASYQIGATSGDRYLHTHIHTHVYQYF